MEFQNKRFKDVPEIKQSWMKKVQNLGKYCSIKAHLQNYASSHTSIFMGFRKQMAKLMDLSLSRSKLQRPFQGLWLTSSVQNLLHNSWSSKTELKRVKEQEGIIEMYWERLSERQGRVTVRQGCRVKIGPQSGDKPQASDLAPFAKPRIPGGYF